MIYLPFHIKRNKLSLSISEVQKVGSYIDCAEKNPVEEEKWLNFGKEKGLLRFIVKTFS